MGSPKRGDSDPDGSPFYSERIRFPLSPLSFSWNRLNPLTPTHPERILVHLAHLWFTLVDPHLLSSESSLRLAQPPLISGSSGSTRRIQLFPSLLLDSERILLPPHSFSTSIPAHTSASFPAGSRARFKRPRAASNAATLSIHFEHSCSFSPPFRPVPRGLSARVRRRTRLFPAHFWAPISPCFVHPLFVSHGSAHLLGILHLFASLLAFSGHFCFPWFRPLSGRIPLTLSIPIIFKII